MGMYNTLTQEFGEIEKRNLKRAFSIKEMHSFLTETIKKQKKGSIIMLESPVENYFKTNVESIKLLLDKGFDGVYMSFQRPFKNVNNFFSKNDVDINRLFVIDGASSSIDSIQDDNPRCIRISPSCEIEEMLHAIKNSLSRLNNKKRFVFIDSLSTMALCKTSSETYRFLNDLMKLAEKKEFKDVTFLFNTAEGLAEKSYSKKVSLYADEHIHLGLCT